MKKHNFIVILSEDICPNLGCYGDENAKTPNLDAFAKENVKFNYCYSAAPVCSAARTSLNLGMYGTTAGVGNHRSEYELPEQIGNFGNYMQKAGYYTIIGKTDLNFPLRSGYDAQVHYDGKDTPNFATSVIADIKAAGDKPVFFLQTTAITHQSQYGYTEDTQLHRTSMPRLQEDEYQDRPGMEIPGYHYKTSEADEVWAQYHEKMTSMDRMFGELVAAMKAEGIYEDSILIFVGDNGHGIPGGKINLWNEGVHVPMIAHVPADLEGQLVVSEDENGKYSDRLTCFIDFAATALDINGEEIPSHLQGKPFLGEHRVDAPEEVYSFSARTDESFENSRSVHEKDLMYTCDFGLTPYRRLNVYQTVQSPWFVRSMIEECYKNDTPDTDRRAFFRQMPRISEQLFDLAVDENSLINFAKERPEETSRLRDKMFTYMEEMRDDTLIEESIMNEYIRATGLTAYEILQKDEYYPIKACIDMWIAGMDGKELDQDVTNPCLKMILTKFMNDRGEKFDKFLNDESDAVSAYTAYRVGDAERLTELAKTTTCFVQLMFITDMISNTREKCFIPTYKVISDRVFGENRDIKGKDRFQAGMVSAINMLSVRMNSDLPEGMLVDELWKDDKFVNSRMVIDALDLQ
ncbi:MAG: sulfatase-like hydrolase/transferase [Lachnospiraceae bacterium]